MNRIALCVFMVFLFAAGTAHAFSTRMPSPVFNGNLNCAGVPSKNATIRKAENNKLLYDETVYDVPIILYHHVKPEKLGKKYSVTPEEFEEDLVFLQEHGFTTITVSELTAFKNGLFEMPSKPVILTFDDGRYNNFTRVMPLLKKYNAKASFFIIGIFAERSSDGRTRRENYSYMNFEDLREMQGSGFCDIQSHSYDLHNTGQGRFGVGKKKNESFEDYEKALTYDLMKNQRLLKEKCGAAPSAFAYPFGVYNTDAEKIIRSMGFSAALKAESGQNKISRGGESFLSLNRVSRNHGIRSNSFFEKYFPQLI